MATSTFIYESNPIESSASLRFFHVSSVTNEPKSRTDLIRECRRIFLADSQNILALPVCLGFTPGKLCLISRRTDLPAALQQDLLKHGLRAIDVSSDSSAGSGMAQVGLRFALEAKLAPDWNRVGGHFVKQADFLAKNYLEAVKPELNYSDGADKITLTLSGLALRWNRIQLRDMAIEQRHCDLFVRGEIEIIPQRQIGAKRVVVLPNLTRARIESVTKQLVASTSKIESVSDMRQYWKDLYGYDLPQNDCPFYVNVTFGKHSELFCYPCYCVRAYEPLPVQRSEFTLGPEIVESFMASVKEKFTHFCGSQLEFRAVSVRQSGQLQSHGPGGQGDSKAEFSGPDQVRHPKDRFQLFQQDLRSKISKNLGGRKDFLVDYQHLNSRVEANKKIIPMFPNKRRDKLTLSQKLAQFKARAFQQQQSCVGQERLKSPSFGLCGDGQGHCYSASGSTVKDNKKNQTKANFDQDQDQLFPMSIKSPTSMDDGNCSQFLLRPTTSPLLPTSQADQHLGSYERQLEPMSTKGPQLTTSSTKSESFQFLKPITPSPPMMMMMMTNDSGYQTGCQKSQQQPMSTKPKRQQTLHEQLAKFNNKRVDVEQPFKLDTTKFNDKRADDVEQPFQLVDDTANLGQLDSGISIMDVNKRVHVGSSTFFSSAQDQCVASNVNQNFKNTTKFNSVPRRNLFAADNNDQSTKKPNQDGFVMNFQRFKDNKGDSGKDQRLSTIYHQSKKSTVAQQLEQFKVDTRKRPFPLDSLQSGSATKAAKKGVPMLDIEQLASSGPNILGQRSTIPHLTQWLRSKGVACKSKTKKDDLVAKVFSHLGMAHCQNEQ